MANKPINKENENVSSEKDLMEKNKQLQSEIDKMKSQLDMLLAGATLGGMNQNSSNAIPNDKTYTLYTNVLNGYTISSPDYRYKITVPYEHSIEATYDDMFQIMKNPDSKKVFERGLIYFEDKEHYKDFRINKYTTITEKDIINLFTKKDNEDIMKQLGKWTFDGKNKVLTHTVYYMIVSLSASGKLDMPSSKIQVIKDFFNADIADGIKNYRFFEETFKGR